MVSLGARSTASLLSALAEAPDFSAGASFLLAQLVDLTGTHHAAMLCLDTAQESLTVDASHGIDADTPPSLPLAEFTNPIVVAALSLTAVRGNQSLASRELGAFTEWTALPMSQPRFRGASEALAEQRAAELLNGSGLSLTPVDRRFGTVPFGAVLLDGPLDAGVFEEVLDVVSLASPVLARLSALQEAWELNDRLGQQREHGSHGQRDDGQVDQEDAAPPEVGEQPAAEQRANR